MKQTSYGDAELAKKGKKTWREVFLGEMEHVVPWKSLRNLIEPFYLVAGRGRHPYPLDTLSRVRPMQNWFGLSEQYAPGIARIRPPMHSEPDR